ncbi:MAG TPA: MarC family protein [Bacteroidales bacterium]|nr:MarC family protein [Bacteroidales bacterium]HPT20952.1 MarC family protein [Bacteroidales bacterium]
MTDLAIFLPTVFLGFFAMLNPIGNTPVFISMVGDADRKIIKRVAFRAVLTAFLIITVFSLFGHIIFRMFGITLPAFQIAGGVIVFLIGYNLLQGKKTDDQHSEVKISLQSYEDMAISPLGIPLLAGPGTISTAMNFVGEGNSFLVTILIVMIFGLVCAITYYMFIVSKKIADKLSQSLIKVISRIMGLILAVIAVQMLINGIFNVIKEYPH